MGQCEDWAYLMAIKKVISRTRQIYEILDQNKLMCISQEPQISELWKNRYSIGSVQMITEWIISAYYPYFSGEYSTSWIRLL